MIMHSPKELPESNDFSIEQLLTPNAFPHATSQFELIETHISWVILTGEFAYKIKKPVNFGFVDYSTLNRRKQFCELEVELNRRFAKGLYVGVANIFRQPSGHLAIDDSPLENQTTNQRDTDNIPIEYAVKMRQFPQSSVVASRLNEGSLDGDSIETFGKSIAKLHQSLTPVADETNFANPEQIVSDALENFPVAKSRLLCPSRRTVIEKMENWTKDQSRELHSAFEYRRSQNFVKRCHGDLHLKNIIQWNDELVAFDGIEFNEALQWIDVFSEIAFPVMDFVARGRADLGWRLINSYLELTGNYENLEVLRYYLVYRAMVRVKVTCLNPANWHSPTRSSHSKSGEPDSSYEGPWDKYLAAAEYFAFKLKPKVAITHGFSGSGKSTVAIQVVEEDGGIRVRSDVERHRLANRLKPKEKYTAETSDQVYDHLLTIAGNILDAGFPVVIDATFLSRQRRQMFALLAQRRECEFEILDCGADYDTLCQRIQTRKSDPSEATKEVLDAQIRSHDPLTTDEAQFVTRFSD